MKIYFGSLSLSLCSKHFLTMNRWTECAPTKREFSFYMNGKPHTPPPLQPPQAVCSDIQYTPRTLLHPYARQFANALHINRWFRGTHIQQSAH